MTSVLQYHALHVFVNPNMLNNVVMCTLETGSSDLHMMIQSKTPVTCLPRLLRWQVGASPTVLSIPKTLPLPLRGP